MNKSRFTTLLAAAGLLVLLVMPVAGEQRVALVIGNAQYAHAPRLANPLNDAADIGAALSRLGFAVTKLENANYTALRQALLAFGRAAAAADVAVVFYAGHGIEVDQGNFLVPVDAKLVSDQDVEFETVPLELVMRSVGRAAGFRLVILDACRENPFVVSMQRAGATRSVGRGLARVEPAGETLVAYAAKEGTVASDGEGRNSPYSEALLLHLGEPGLEVGLLFRKVRDAVLASTGGRQEPFVYGSLSSRGVYLVAQVPDEEKERWEAIQKSTDPSDFRTFLKDFKDFPDEQYVAEARRRLTRLEEVRWAAVKDSTDPSDLRAFLRDFSDGHFAKEAERLLEQLPQVAPCAKYLQEDNLVSATHCYQRVLSKEADHELAKKGLYEVADHYYTRAAKIMEEARPHAQSYDRAMLRVAEAVRQLEGVDAQHPGIGELRSRWKVLRRGDETQLTTLQAEFERLQGENERLREESVKQSQTLRQAQEQVTRLKREARQKDQALQQALEEVVELKRVVKTEEEARNRRELEPGRHFRDCPQCPEMVVVPSGSFRMGSPASEEERYEDEGPVHGVTIPEPFAVGVYEVTFQEWDACVSGGGCNGYRPDDKGWGRGNRPVIRVNWDDAQAYVRWLSDKTRQRYRLLSESEWEYVARAGTTSPFHTGSTISTDQANYNGNFTYGTGREGVYRRRTVEVGSFSPNAFGLHNVHGNVREWVQDCWNDSYRGAPDNGRAWGAGDCSRRVARGGSWNYRPRYLRSASRSRNTTGNRVDILGFRVARTLTP